MSLVKLYEFSLDKIREEIINFIEDYKDKNLPLKRFYELLPYITDSGINFTFSYSGLLEYTLLILASKEGVVEIVKSLIENGANVNSQNSTGMAPLHYSSYYPESNYVKLSQLLIDSGANLELEDEVGNTPLMLAVKRDNVPVVKVFLNNGADLDTRDKYGETLLSVSSNKSKIKHLLLKEIEKRDKSDES